MKRKSEKKKNLEYIEKTFTNREIVRILELACRRIKENYPNTVPEYKIDKKIWFELFYQKRAGYNGEKLRDL